MTDFHRAAACLGASAAFAFTTQVAHAASFDRAKASTGMKRLIFGDALGAQDEILAMLYAGALKAAGCYGGEAAQRRWVRKARDCATVNNFT